MPKDYKSNQRLKEYVEYNVANMGINEEFSPLLVDVMLRRFAEFDFSNQEIYKDMLSLVNNLRGINIGQMPNDSPNAAGVYFYDERKITLSEDYIKKAKTPEDFERLYEIFTHEAFHALARDEYGNSKISKKNSYTDVAYHSLEEAIVEKAADRCVYGRRWNEANSPFFHQNEFGYSDITYITDIIEAAYGVTEKAFLKHAIQGRTNVEEFLSDISGEREEDTLDYLDRIELNYASLHNALYRNKLSPEMSAKVIKDAMTAGLLVSSWKMNENIERLEHSGNDFQTRVEDFKYGHNKMFLVTKHAAQNFDSRFSGQNIYDYVQGAIKDTREDNSYRINTLSEIIKNKQNMPEDDFLKLVEEVKSGQKTLEVDELLKKYQISQEAPEFIPLDSESYLGFRRMDFETTDWDNSQISEDVQVFKKMYEDMNKNKFVSNLKNGVDKIKKAFEKATQFL